MERLQQEFQLCDVCSADNRFIKILDNIKLNNKAAKQTEESKITNQTNKTRDEFL